jgi:hypothetical protein
MMIGGEPATGEAADPSGARPGGESAGYSMLAFYLYTASHQRWHDGLQGPRHQHPYPPRAIPITDDLDADAHDLTALADALRHH